MYSVIRACIIVYLHNIALYYLVVVGVYNNIVIATARKHSVYIMRTPVFI